MPKTAQTDETKEEDKTPKVETPPEEPTPPEPTPIEPEVVEIKEGDGLEELAAAGFTSKEQVAAYVKAISANRKEQLANMKQLAECELELENKVEKLKIKEKAVGEKAAEVSAKLAEQKELFTKNIAMAEKFKKLKIKV